MITTLPLPLRRSAMYWQLTCPAWTLLEVTVASTPPSAPVSTAITAIPACFAFVTAGAIPLLSNVLLLGAVELLVDEIERKHRLHDEFKPD